MSTWPQFENDKIRVPILGFPDPKLVILCPRDIGMNIQKVTPSFKVNEKKSSKQIAYQHLEGASNPVWESSTIGVKEGFLKEVISKLNSEGQVGVNHVTRKEQCVQRR